MAEKKHLKLWKTKNHKDEDGCVNKHEVGFEKISYPNCAYRPNGYDATLSGKVKGTATTKRSLYQYDFTIKHPEGTPITENHQGRLTKKKMERFKATGRQSDAEKKKKIPRRTYTNSDPRKLANAWHFTGNNYKEWHLPFGHEYHHIMPKEAIFENLTFREAKILQSSGYNINHGKNIIILPITADVAYALMLPKHKGWHRSYNKECAKALNRLKKSSNKTPPPHRITEENKGGVKTNLENWQESQYKVLVDYGRKTAVEKKAAAEINKMYPSRS